MRDPMEPGLSREIATAGGFSPETLETLLSVLGADRMQVLFQVSRLEFAHAGTRLNRAVEAQDIVRCREEAHALRGAAGNIGAVNLAEAVSRYEQALHEEVQCPERLKAIHAALLLADEALALFDLGL
jgi:HPt (histidine-containing phosphotransfer) domain-containing protein